MKMTYLISLVLFTASAAGAFAQNEKNPFKERNAKTAEEAKSRPVNIISLFEYIEVPKQKLDHLLINSGELEITREQAQKWVDAGESKVIRSSLTISLNTEKGRNESLVEVYRPTKYNSVGVGAWPVPASFVKQNLGFSEDFELHINEDGKGIESRIVVDYSVLKEGPAIHPLVTKTREPEDVLMASLSHSSFTFANLSMKFGESYLIGRLEDVHSEGMSCLVFYKAAKWQVPLLDSELRKGESDDQQYTMHAHFVTVNQYGWSEIVSDTPLSELAESSWEKVLRLAKVGEAEFDGSLVMRSAHNHRAKATNVTQIPFSLQFAQSINKGGASIPPLSVESALVTVGPGGEMNNKELTLMANHQQEEGLSLEFYCDFEQDGAYLKYFSAPKKSSLAGYSVHHRVRDGETWIPDAETPRIKSSTIHSAFMLTPNQMTLAGVLGGTDKDGKPDPKKLTLLFVEAKL